MDDTAAGSYEVAGDVTAILIDSIADLDGTEITNLLMCGNKVLGKQFAYLGV